MLFIKEDNYLVNLNAVYINILNQLQVFNMLLST